MPESNTASPEVIAEVVAIKRTAINYYTDQPRDHIDELKLMELCDSISELGQQTPIHVRRISGNPDFSFELIAGERRCRACEMAGIDVMKAIIIKVADEDEQYILAAIENEGREGYTLLEQMAIVDRFVNGMRMPLEKAARLLGHSDVWIKDRLLLLGLHADVKRYLGSTAPRNERLSIGIAKEIATNVQPSAQLGVAEHILLHDMTYMHARFYIREKTGKSCGVRDGTHRKPSDDFKVLCDLWKATRKKAGAFLAMKGPAFAHVFRFRSKQDMFKLATGLEDCISDLQIILDEVNKKASGK